MATPLDTILKDVAGVEGAIPLITGLIAMLKQNGDPRTSEEINAEAQSVGAKTAEIVHGDEI